MDLRICLNLSTVGHLDYESQLKTSAQGGFKAVGLRINRLEEYLASGHTIEEAKGLLERNELIPVEMNFFSDWIYARGKGQREILDRFRNFSEISGALGCHVIIATTQCEGDPDEVLAQENFKEICHLASESDVLVALEFLPWSPLNTIRKAWEIVNKVDHPKGGIALDTFHYFKGGSSQKDLWEVPIDKVFIVHLADVVDIQADVVTLCRNYRVLPGEGIFIFDEFLEYLFKRGYKDYYSLEILNKDYPLEDPLEICTRAKSSMEDLLASYAQKFEKGR